MKDDDYGAQVGYVTSAFWSPNPESNFALAVLPRTQWTRGTRVKVQLPKDGIVDFKVSAEFGTDGLGVEDFGQQQSRAGHRLLRSLSR